ncbi:hypothetical protein LIER_18169 [Lithospermum erythrorhizon]|uniref:Retrotransposon gag domain-containing protein n=1 Tax=Lithospermum erythrorhizon TaxID=34254 RepID=A0AAV3QCZ4_LITER
MWRDPRRKEGPTAEQNPNPLEDILADLPEPATRRKVRSQRSVPRRTISTRLTQVGASPIQLEGPVESFSVSTNSQRVKINCTKQVAPSVGKDTESRKNISMSVHESSHHPYQHVLSNGQPRNQYPEDIKAEIQRWVNEQLNRERERTIQSSRHINQQQREAARRTRDNHERHSSVPAEPSQVPTSHADPATIRLQQELADIKEMMKAFMPAVIQKRECKTKMPFTDRLDGIPLPQGFTLPQFTQFNGTGDPVKHLQGFLAKMTITSNNPDIYAKAFSNSLSDRALDWYMALPLNSIDSYQQTADVFIAKFGFAIQKH